MHCDRQRWKCSNLWWRTSGKIWLLFSGNSKVLCLCFPSGDVHRTIQEEWRTSWWRWGLTSLRGGLCNKKLKLFESRSTFKSCFSIKKIILTLKIWFRPANGVRSQPTFKNRRSATILVIGHSVWALTFSLSTKNKVYASIHNCMTQKEKEAQTKDLSTQFRSGDLCICPYYSMYTKRKMLFPSPFTCV